MNNQKSHEFNRYSITKTSSLALTKQKKVENLLSIGFHYLYPFHELNWIALNWIPYRLYYSYCKWMNMISLIIILLLIIILIRSDIWDHIFLFSIVLLFLLSANHLLSFLLASYSIIICFPAKQLVWYKISSRSKDWLPYCECGVNPIHPSTQKIKQNKTKQINKTTNRKGYQGKYYLSVVFIRFPSI